MLNTSVFNILSLYLHYLYTHILQTCIHVTTLTFILQIYMHLITYMHACLHTTFNTYSAYKIFFSMNESNLHYSDSSKT